MSTQYEITVILCTYNRAELLAGALQSLVSLETDGEFTYEVLVVDNASTDHTQQVVADFAERHDLSIRVVREDKPGPAAARNCGIRGARGQWLAFLDDDELADPSWLLELRRLAREKNCQVVGGAVRLVLTEDQQQELSPYLERLLAPGGRHASVCRFTPQNALNGGNAMIHRDVFARIGRYDEDRTEGGEDTDWFYRVHAAQVDAWYTPRAIVRHLVPGYRLSPAYLRWVSLRQGWSTARQVGDRRGKAQAALRGVLRLIKGGLVHVPLFCWASLAFDANHRLFRRCQLWRVQGYLRNAFRQLAPGLLAQHEFDRWLEFRGERQQFSQ